MSEFASGIHVARKRVSARVCFHTRRTRRRSLYHRQVCRQEFRGGMTQTQTSRSRDTPTKDGLNNHRALISMEEYGNNYKIYDFCSLTKVTNSKTKKRLVLKERVAFPGEPERYTESYCRGSQIWCWTFSAPTEHTSPSEHSSWT